MDVGPVQEHVRKRPVEFDAGRSLNRGMSLDRLVRNLVNDVQSVLLQRGLAAQDVARGCGHCEAETIFGLFPLHLTSECGIRAEHAVEPFLLAIRDGLPPSMFGHLNHHSGVLYLGKKQCDRRTLRISKMFESKARSSLCDCRRSTFLRQGRLGSGCRQEESS